MASAAADSGSRLIAWAGDANALELDTEDAIDSQCDNERELVNMASCLTGGVRGGGDADDFELEAGDDVRSMTDTERELEKKVSGRLAFTSSATANLCLALVCEVSAGDVRNLRGQNSHPNVGSATGGMPGTVYFSSRMMRWPRSRWEVKPAKVPRGCPSGDA
jgi:hypothetical protein